MIIDSLLKRSWSITSYNRSNFKTEVKTVKIPDHRNSGFVRTLPLFSPSLILLFFFLLLCHYPKSFSSQETSYLWIYIFAHVFMCLCVYIVLIPSFSFFLLFRMSLCLHICRQTLILILVQIIISICANCPPLVSSSFVPFSSQSRLVSMQIYKFIFCTHLS